jgi:acetyl esterase/lipase
MITVTNPNAGVTPDTRSLAAKAMPAVMALRGSKRRYSSAAATLAQAEQLRLRPVSYAPPKSIDKWVDVSVQRVNGWPVYVLAPRWGAPRPGTPQRQAVYVHGGSWIHEISPFHWRFIADLSSATGTTFTVPIYPLAPLGTAETVIPAISDLTADLMGRFGAGNVTLVGDSAGGTIALAVALSLRDRGYDAIRHCILISPAVDLSFTDPHIPALALNDPWLAVPGLRATAGLWRGGLPIDDPMVSPLYGDLAGLPPLTVFTGTFDILNADAKALHRHALNARHPINYVESAGLLHVYPLLPMREASEAKAVIRAILAPGG